MYDRIQNRIYKGYNNPVIIDFVFYDAMSSQGLSNFTKMVVDIGNETYSTDTTPDNLYVEGDSLFLDIGEVTQLPVGTKEYTLTIIGYNNEYQSGYVLQSSENNILNYGITIS